MRGYYSIIQYCPDPARAEVANVGVVLVCPDKGFLDVRMSNGNDAPRRIFGTAGGALARLDQAKDLLEELLKTEKERLRNPEALQNFIATRGNDLILTPLRNMRVGQPEQDLTELFKELVGGRARGDRIERAERGVSLKRELRELFSTESMKRKVEVKPTAHPLYSRPFEADYAFYNGKASFIVAPVVHVNEEQTMKEAELLATRGRQLMRHGHQGENAELIVPLPTIPGALSKVAEQVGELLRDNDIRVYRATELNDLVHRIEEHAHDLSELKK